MIDLKYIRSLSEFQRNAKSHIRRLKKTGKPEVLTVNGQAAVVVQEPDAYQKLLDAVEEAETIKAISEGLASAKRGEGSDMFQFLERLGQKHGIDLQQQKRPKRGKKRNRR